MRVLVASLGLVLALACAVTATEKIWIFGDSNTKGDFVGSGDTCYRYCIINGVVQTVRQFTDANANFLGFCVPGMERCHMVSTPNTIGLRESRRVHGCYTLTQEDVLGQRTFDDSIGYGSFFIDIHNCSGIGMDRKTIRPEPGFKYQIPYGIIVPRDIDCLWVAGRCASATHEALGSLRVMPQCGVMGQAAGTAALLSIRGACTNRDVPVAQLQASLREQGCIVSEGDIG